MAITTASRKGKGRRLQDSVKEMLLKKYDVDPDLIKTAIMGESGKDVKIFGMAKNFIPFDIECKNTEKLSVWSAIEQAEANTEGNRIPLVVFKRNRSKTYAIIKFEDLLEIASKEYSKHTLKERFRKIEENESSTDI